MADYNYDPSVLRWSSRIFLFLQGPRGPFFRKLKNRLDWFGYQSYFINVCGGDLIDRPLALFDSYMYSGKSGDRWEKYLACFIREKHISDVVLYGIRSSYHSTAVQLCRDNGIRLWIFDECLFLPGYVTLERDSEKEKTHVSGICPGDVRSCDDQIDFLISEKKTAIGEHNRVNCDYGDPLPSMPGQFFLTPLFPHFRPYSDYSAFSECLSRFRGMFRNFSSEKKHMAEAAGILSSKNSYFFLTLQFCSDYQISVSSPFGSARKLIEAVVRSFAESAVPDLHLVIAANYREFSDLDPESLVNTMNSEFNLHDRVHFVGNCRTEELIENSAGVLAASTVMGLVSLSKLKHTAALCDVSYTGQGPAVMIAESGQFNPHKLDDFWNSHVTPSRSCIGSFFRLLKDQFLVPGNFYTGKGIREAVSRVPVRMGIGGIANCIIFRRPITRIKNIRLFLDSVSQKTVVGWGYKPTARRARAYAAAHNLPYYALEDGFIKSVATEYRGRDEEVLSLILDRTGIYYNVASSSELEDYMVRSEEWFTGELAKKARKLINTIVTNRIVKYNARNEISYSEFIPPNIPSDAILVIDQTRNDASITQGNADQSSFDEMLKEAISTAGAAGVYVKEHPNVFASRGKGYFKISKLKKLGVNIITAPVNSVELMQSFRNVYVVTSGTGFEALMCGCSVTCFGEPFYSGYGLTTDRKNTASTKRKDRMKSRATVEMLAAAVFYRYSIFIDPKTCTICTPEHALQYIISRKHGREEQQVRS